MAATATTEEAMEKLVTFLGKRRHAVVETTKSMGRWATKVTLVKSSPKRLSERTLYADSRKEGLQLAREFVA